MLSYEIGDRLRKLGSTLAVAESFTGGLLASRITDVPGCSDYFVGGIVAYSDAAKEALLFIPKEVIMRFGAVSLECAQAMAEGARRAFGADFALATTGIAGPSGGTPEKPVGLGYVALATPSGEALVRELRLVGSRQGNKWSATEAALELLAEHLRRHG